MKKSVPPIDAIVAAVDAAVNSMEGRLREEIARQVEYHRRAQWVRDTWCCPEMTTFATEVWMMPNPGKRDESSFGSLTLQLRSSVVNYCPFCGVFVGRAKT